jgi:4-amino-4-deoxy-L-arabinose transferase-like glycosyltransferase
MNDGFLSIKFVFIDKYCIFVVEINYLIDMIVFLIFLVAFFCLVFILRGEGNSYGNTRSYKDRMNISDKNYFL